MSDLDTRNRLSYSGHPLRRASTLQGLRFDSRMIRSRRGSAISSLSQTSSYPCDSAGHLEDPDHGGVPLGFTTIDPSPDPHGLHGHQLFLYLPPPLETTAERLWNTPEGSVRITTQADLYESRAHQSNTYDRPPGDFGINDFMPARYQQVTVTIQTPHFLAPSGLPRDSAVEVHSDHPSTAPSNSPSSPAEASSTRWPATDTTLLNLSAQSTPEFPHEAFAWVDYNVAEFLEAWNIQYCMGKAGLVHIDEERKRQWQPLDQAPFGNCDLQGLDWAALDTSRSKARLARKLLYPVRYSWMPPPTYDENSAFRQQHMYASRDFYPNHRASHSHSQLRNVLAARSRNDVFYASKSKVMHTSLSCPAYSDVVLNFSGSSTNPNQAGDTKITSIAVSAATDFDGYYSDAVLVTGGMQGEYSVLNLYSILGARPIQGFVTVAEQKEITHVHVLGHRRTAALGAVFCSNDSKVRLLDINTNSWSSEFEYENQINCAATSPDGRLRMIVGDTCETLLTDAERGDVLRRMRQHEGYGFACAWAADGWHVATGSEDGKVVVYDARRWDMPLAALECEMSSARSLHFTTSSHRGTSLVVAESEDIVSVYDSTNWNNKQTVDFFGSVVGAVSVDDGQELIVANGDPTVGGLMVFERQQHIPGAQQDDYAYH